MELSNNTILITGGTSGFGLEFAKRFLALGNTVIITGRNHENLDEVKRMFPAVHTFQSDVGFIEDIEELFEKVTVQFPGLNILVNNAGEMRKISLHHNYPDGANKNGATVFTTLKDPEKCSYCKCYFRNCLDGVSHSTHL
jgi:uncharacterized oxidoreductase